MLHARAGPFHLWNKQIPIKPNICEFPCDFLKYLCTASFFCFLTVINYFVLPIKHLLHIYLVKSLFLTVIMALFSKRKCFVYHNIRMFCHFLHSTPLITWEWRLSLYLNTFCQVCLGSFFIGSSFWQPCKGSFLLVFFIGSWSLWSFCFVNLFRFPVFDSSV